MVIEGVEQMKLNCMVMRNGSRMLSPRSWRRRRLTVEEQERMRARGYMVVAL